MVLAQWRTKEKVLRGAGRSWELLGEADYWKGGLPLSLAAEL